MRANERELEILAVEDNPADVKMIATLLKKNINPKLNFVPDGVSALEYLRKQGKYADAVRPDIVLLDLNLPRMDGRAVLREMKADPAFNCIPVLILSTSNNEDDIHRCYQLQASCYFTKPADLHEFVTIMSAIENCWLKLVRLPDYPELHESHNKQIA